MWRVGIAKHMRERKQTEVMGGCVQGQEAWSASESMSEQNFEVQL